MMPYRSKSPRLLPWMVAAAFILMSVFGGLTQGAPMEMLSSGVGQDNRVAHPDYSLKLVFALSSGAYLANVDVVVHDQDGKEVLRTNSNGPWLFVKLPPGAYRVRAERKDGTAASARFVVTGERQSVVRLTWTGER